MTDEDLISQYLSGDENSIGILIKNYLIPIFNFIYRLIGDSKTAEDLTQETFIKVWKNIKKFDRNKKFKPWLFKIARNTAFDYLRKKKDVNFTSLSKITGEGDETAFEPVDLARSFPEQLEQKELAVKLDQGLSQLPGADRSLLLLYYTEDITFREIAEIMTLPIDTVKTRHRRALIKLREIIKNAGTV